MAPTTKAKDIADEAGLPDDDKAKMPGGDLARLPSSNQWPLGSRRDRKVLSGIPGESPMIDAAAWEQIEALGPLTNAAFFDPLVVDDVTQAERSATQFDRRRAFVANYAWAVPTREAVKRIDDFVGERTLLEICAGQGLWASLISLAGTAVVATDGQAAAGAHFPVELGEAKAAVLSHAECRALLVCWPPFKESCAFHALSAFTGDRVVYVGDVRFTAEARFHSLLDASWRLTEQIALPSWPGTADFAFFYVRA